MIGDSSIKNFHCMLNLNKINQSQKYACGPSDHPTMPSINDLLYTSKKEIESFNSLISVLRPNSSLESLMSNYNISSSLRKKKYFSLTKFNWTGCKKKKNNQNIHRPLSYTISADESIEQELQQLEREIEADIHDATPATTGENPIENNHHDIQHILDSISRRRSQHENTNVDVDSDDDDLSGILSSSSSNSSRNSTSHSSNRDSNEVNDSDEDNNFESDSTSSSDEENEPSSNAESTNRRNALMNRFQMWAALHHLVENAETQTSTNQNPNQNEAENEDLNGEILISNDNTEDDIEEGNDLPAYYDDDDDDDNFEDISAIFDSIQESRDVPSELHTIHANTAVITATSQLTPAGETEENISSITDFPDSFTDIIDDELKEEKEKKKSSHKKTKKKKKSGLPVPEPMTLEEAFDFISFVKKEASNSSNDNDGHSHNGSKKKISNGRDNSSANLCFC